MKENIETIIICELEGLERLIIVLKQLKIKYKYVWNIRLLKKEEISNCRNIKRFIFVSNIFDNAKKVYDFLNYKKKKKNYFFNDKLELLNIVSEFCIFKSIRENKKK